MACSQMWSEYPQLTLNHFFHVLKKHSVRTDAEKDKILGALKIVMSGKGQRISLPLSATAMPKAPAVTAHSFATEASPVEAATAISPIPVRSAPKSPAPERGTPAKPTPASPTAPPMRPARPSIFKAIPTHDDQRRKVRKAFEQVMREQNLPDTTLAEKKHRVLSAAITLWQHNPQLAFAQVERQLHYYLDFTMAEAAAMGEVLKQHAPVTAQQAALRESTEDNLASP